MPREDRGIGHVACENVHRIKGLEADCVLLATQHADRLTDRQEETTMTTDEASRHHLYEQARTALGEAAADTLMTALPRDPDRFATKDDLAVLGAGLHTEITRLEAKIDVLAADLGGEIKSEISGLLRTMFLGMIASNATLVGLVFAAVRLA